MKVTVAEIAFTEEKTSKAGKQYTLTTFKDETGKLYKDVYGKLTQGDIVDGEWKKDNYGNDKFEIVRPSNSGFGGGGRQNDPATRSSIERQSALKAAVEAVRDYCALYQSKAEAPGLELYITRIVNTTNVFAEAIAKGTPAVSALKPPEPVREDVQAITNILGGDEVALSADDQIDLSSIPF